MQTENVLKAGEYVTIKRLGCKGLILDSRVSDGRTLYFIAYEDEQHDNRRKWISAEALVHINKQLDKAEIVNDAAMTGDMDSQDTMTGSRDEMAGQDETVKESPRPGNEVSE